MDESFFVRFSSSLTGLEAAIEKAKGAITQNPSLPRDLVDRVHSYRDIVAKQRTLLAELHVNFSQTAVDELCRNVNLINSLSRLMLDDASAILALVKTGRNDEQTDASVC